MKTIKEFLQEYWYLTLSVIYLLIPIDFIPELLLGPFGLIDDAGLLFSAIVAALFQFARKKWLQSKEKVTGREETVKLGEVKAS